MDIIELTGGVRQESLGQIFSIHAFPVVNNLDLLNPRFPQFHPNGLGACVNGILH